MSKKSHRLPLEPYLSIGQAAKLLSVHPSTIRRWIDRGRLVAYRIGERRVGVRPADLARLITRRPARLEHAAARTQVHCQKGAALTKEQRRQGLQALAALERLSAAIEARHGGRLTPESWELINRSRDERTRDLSHIAQ